MAQVREIVEARDHIVHLRCVIFAPTAESLKIGYEGLGSSGTVGSWFFCEKDKYLEDRF